MLLTFNTLVLSDSVITFQDAHFGKSTIIVDSVDGQFIYWSVATGNVDNPLRLSELVSYGAEYSPPESRRMSNAAMNGYN